MRLFYRLRKAFVRTALIALANLPAHSVAVIGESEATRASIATAGGASSERANDFVIVSSDLSTDQSKFLTYGWNGFAGGQVNWLYNDTNRPPAIVATSALALQKIQTAMGKWSAVCNIQFNYAGTTSNGPSLALPVQTFDGVNVVAWAAQGTGGQTGLAGVGAGGSPIRLVEADIAVNYQFNPAVDRTLLHEVGHMLGLKHSDVQNAVLSGPPLTSYVSLNELTADDISGCQNLYGPPVATTRTISGTISNGGAVSNVTFCARPPANVVCAASNGSGAYSCTVPNGWAGTLHSPSVANNRIPPQTFTAVTASVTRNITALSGVPGCNLDVDNNGLIEPTTDGAAILRRMLGFKDAAFAGLAGTCAANTTGTAIFNATTSNYNVTGGVATRASTDGMVILRAMNGKTGTDVTNGLGLSNESGASNTGWSAIQSWLNTTCGSNF